jgi:hypothetical protein
MNIKLYPIDKKLEDETAKNSEYKTTWQQQKSALATCKTEQCNGRLKLF